MLVGMQGFAMVLSFAFTILITKGLNVADYGVFRYGMTFLAFSMTVLQFGWPYSASRLLALQNDKAIQTELVGACVISMIIGSIAGTACTLVALYLAEALGYHPPRVLMWVAPFLYVTLGQSMIGSICQGLNRISLLSFQQVLPYLLLLPITAVQIFVIGAYSLKAALIGYVAAFTVVIVVGYLRLGVTFAHSKSWLRAITAENRRTGFPIYIGGLFGVASAQLIAMSVAEYVPFARYGQYALAMSVSAPLSVLVSSVGTVIFRSSSTRTCLSSRVLIYSIGFGALLGFLFFVATETMLVRAFGSQYKYSVRMAQVMGVGSLMIGWGDIFQRFLGAQGEGRGLCFAAVCTGTVGGVSAIVLMPQWDAYGAIASSVLAGATYLGLNVWLYCRHTARSRPEGLVAADSGSISRKVKSAAA